MMQIVGGPCLKAGPGPNGKHQPLASQIYSRWHGSDWSLYILYMVCMGTLKQWHCGECCEHDPSGVQWNTNVPCCKQSIQLSLMMNALVQDFGLVALSK